MSNQGDVAAELPELDQRARCMSCDRPLGLNDVDLQAYSAGQLRHIWSLCLTCWVLLRSLIETEIATAPASRSSRQPGNAPSPTGKGGPAWRRPRGPKGWIRRA